MPTKELVVFPHVEDGKAQVLDRQRLHHTCCIGFAQVDATGRPAGIARLPDALKCILFDGEVEDALLKASLLGMEGERGTGDEGGDRPLNRAEDDARLKGEERSAAILLVEPRPLPLQFCSQVFVQSKDEKALHGPSIPKFEPFRQDKSKKIAPFSLHKSCYLVIWLRLKSPLHQLCGPAHGHRLPGQGVLRLRQAHRADNEL